MVVDAVMASHTTTASYLDTLKKRTKLSKNVAMPDFLVHPTNRDNALKCGETWLSGKVVDDDIGDLNLWRVHDKLYDLTDFAKKHPGGAFWLDMTRGMVE
ncbi:hypothetical protein SARC_11353 [Sphaeroforma arctica JP610]|uniref:Cytochrome b5 heme-binding domain-containing protein n=1 Tax=Sphaeroforma arctica JP610 TaxID=667725 RepID=A0A0L0FHB6_9EUKA|nr:hypothetical protein SARC_11353 [Sphaeroforma arctica JP610]KNC76135.1 hypothetical protein SARC_11353 [Sphaeroforma arctica JP610]|eukprot:XP_014150037.1 hypothetical protein SARC_11353 [Sphaeroforma arctica JP610]